LTTFWSTIYHHLLKETLRKPDPRSILMTASFAWANTSDFLYKCVNVLLYLADVLKYLNWSNIHRCDFDGMYLRHSESTWLDLSSFSSICVCWRNGPIILVFSMETFPQL